MLSALPLGLWEGMLMSHAPFLGHTARVKPFLKASQPEDPAIS